MIQEIYRQADFFTFTFHSWQPQQLGNWFDTLRPGDEISVCLRLRVRGSLLFFYFEGRLRESRRDPFRFQVEIPGAEKGASERIFLERLCATAFLRAHAQIRSLPRAPWIFFLLCDAKISSRADRG